MWTEGGADCYSQYGASWTLAASSRLAADGRRDEEGGGTMALFLFLYDNLNLEVSRILNDEDVRGANSTP